ncbi:MAG: type II toxin-antitoxin system RelE/ParE family toxin [Candidatus Nealsonbacteria bacterium]
MDKIEKALRKLSQKERRAIKDILQRVKVGNPGSLNIQKLKGPEDIFRVQKGNIRIIYRKTVTGEIFVLAVEHRSEKTYKRF